RRGGLPQRARRLPRQPPGREGDLRSVVALPQLHPPLPAQPGKQRGIARGARGRDRRHPPPRSGPLPGPGRGRSPRHGPRLRVALAVFADGERGKGRVVRPGLPISTERWTGLRTPAAAPPAAHWIPWLRAPPAVGEDAGRSPARGARLTRRRRGGRLPLPPPSASPPRCPGVCRPTTRCPRG